MRIHSKFTQLGKCRLTYNLSLSMELRPSNIHALNLREFFFEHYKTLTSSPIFLILRFSCKRLKLKMVCLNKAPLVFQALLIYIILFTFLSNRKMFWFYMITLHGYLQNIFKLRILVCRVLAITNITAINTKRNPWSLINSLKKLYSHSNK